MIDDNDHLTQQLPLTEWEKSRAATTPPDLSLPFLLPLFVTKQSYCDRESHGRSLWRGRLWPWA